jgi:hypothetical protein
MQDYDARGLRRLDPPAEDDWAAGSATRRRAINRRDTGVRATRRISGWTAAALVAGVAASAGYFAHAAMPAGTTSSTSSTGTASGTGTGTAASQKPSVTHPVVTSGGSGVAAGTVGGAAGGPAGSGNAVHWRDN